MASKNFLLSALAAFSAAVARAAPQRGGAGIVPVRNITRGSDKPTPTSSSCEAACLVRYPELFAISWVPEVQIVYTTMVTVGTVSDITMISGNSTLWCSTRTVYGYVPPEYSLYMITTDAAGTAIVDVGLTISDTYTFAHITYPTPYLDYPSEYHWEGVLPTKDKDASPVCATATELANGILLQHPEYPQPKDVDADKGNPIGANYKPLWIPVQETPEKAWFDETFPSESAFSYCESIPGKPAPTESSAPKFVFETTTVTTSPSTAGVIIIQPSASGWETTSMPTRVPTVHRESSATSWDDTFPETEDPGDPQSTPNIIPDIPRFQSSASGWEDPGANQTPGQPLPGKPKPSVPTIVNTTPRDPAVQPATTPAPVPANLTPIFTFVPTVVRGKSTASPAFVLPGSSVTATIGQTVSTNGQHTVLAAPNSIFAVVPTTINGVATSGPAYIISGTSTASIGQTVTIDGQATVLTPPPPYMTLLATTIAGTATSVPVYIISGSITAAIGQTVTVNGQPTVLPAPEVVYTEITTNINSVKTVLPAYIISGSITATISQAVTLDGQLTTLKLPAESGSVDSQYGGPVDTAFGAPSSTKSAKGAGVSKLNISWHATLISVGIVAVLCL